MNQPKRTLKIDINELEQAFETYDLSLEIRYYLDLETGKVEMTSIEERSLIEEISEEYGDPETGQVDWDKVMPQLDIHDWQKETLLTALRVEEGYNERYIEIPHQESYEGYNDMEAFIATVSNPHIQSRLEWAIQGKGAFRKFKDALFEFPKERERWFKYKQDRLHERVADWLESKGIKAV